MSHRLMAALVAAATLSAAGAAQSAVLVYRADLSAANEVPTNVSAGTGFGIFTIDDVLNTMQVAITFSGLSGTTTASHLHCCAPSGSNAGVATQVPTFSGFPLGVTSGVYSHLFDLTLTSTYNPTFVTSHGGTAASAEAALLAGIASQQSYLNIHSTVVPGGEIRGQLLAVPEPGTWAMMILGFGLAGAGLRTRRRTAVSA
jgi:hypothetical protein